MAAKVAGTDTSRCQTQGQTQGQSLRLTLGVPDETRLVLVLLRELLGRRNDDLQDLAVGDAVEAPLGLVEPRDVLAPAAVETVHLVVVGEGVEDVVPRPAELPVGAAAGPHRVRAAATVRLVVTGSRLDAVAVALAVDLVVPAPGADRVVAPERVDLVGLRSSDERVVPGVPTMSAP